MWSHRWGIVSVGDLWFSWPDNKCKQTWHIQFESISPREINFDGFREQHLNESEIGFLKLRLRKVEHDMDQQRKEMKSNGSGKIPSGKVGKQFRKRWIQADNRTDGDESERTTKY